MFSCLIGMIHSCSICATLSSLSGFKRKSLYCSLLLRRECCSFSNGEYVKAGLAELEQWCIYATEEVKTSFLFLFYFF